MCGRYATTQTPQDLHLRFVAQISDDLGEVTDDFNMAPTKTAAIVRERSDHDGVVREITSAAWGLVPSWAKDRSIGSRLINARSETVAHKPSFRRAFARRRAIVPADGYYEWYSSDDPGVPRSRAGKARKQPFYISAADGDVLAMAGLYEFWRASADDPWTTTFTILTTTAEDELGHLHERMPLMVEPSAWADWLAPTEPGEEPSEQDLLSLLVPAAPGRLRAWPVSTDVNNVRHNGPALREPIALEDPLILPE